MVIALASKPGLTGASALSIPKTWDAAWFRGFINNLLKGGDVRNAVGSGGIVVSGTIASPYATIGFGAPVTLPGLVTITAPASGHSLLVNVNPGEGITVNNTAGGAAGSFLSWRSAGTEVGFIGNGTGIGGANANDFGIGSDSGSIILNSSQGVKVLSPAGAVTALVATGNGAGTFVETLNAGSANMTVALLFLSGGASSAGVETIRMDKCAATGAGTATFTATNKPTATAGGPVTWIPISLDGVRRYIPAWA